MEQIHRKGGPNGCGLNRGGFDGEEGGFILRSAGSRWDGQSLGAFLVELPAREWSYRD